MSKITVTLTCDTCNGDGFYVNYSYDSCVRDVSGCYNCGGDGNRYFYPSNKKDVRDWNNNNFGIKKGSGKVEYTLEKSDKKCDYCEGTGKLKVYEFGSINQVQPLSWSAPKGYKNSRTVTHSNCYGTGYECSFIDSKPSGGCFLTTVVCEILGKDDDCDELQTLRHLRDFYVLKKPDGMAIFANYRYVSKDIIDYILNSENKLEIAKEIFKKIVFITQFVKEENYFVAFELYEQMVYGLRIKFGLN